MLKLSRYVPEPSNNANMQFNACVYILAKVMKLSHTLMAVNFHWKFLQDFKMIQCPNTMCHSFSRIQAKKNNTRIG